LKDAQHVSWKIFRKIDAKLEAEGAKRRNPPVIVTDLLEEAGKVSAVVKSLEGSESSEKSQPTEKLAKELNNVLYSVFVLAEHYGVNLEETFLEHVNDLLLGTLT
jgi:NTP pyrophosphatase (non-canonical NTP hydrolase)